jgi:hypothetical protein
VSELHAATFEPHVGTVFTATDDEDVAVPLTLRAVRRFDTAPGQERFTLVFDGPPSPAAQGTFRFSHAVVGTFVLFITPVIGSDARQTIYEAAFNRLVPKNSDM